MNFIGFKQHSRVIQLLKFLDKWSGFDVFLRTQSEPNRCRRPSRQPITIPISSDKFLSGPTCSDLYGVGGFDGKRRVPNHCVSKTQCPRAVLSGRLIRLATDSFASYQTVGRWVTLSAEIVIGYNRSKGMKIFKYRISSNTKDTSMQVSCSLSA